MGGRNKREAATAAKCLARTVRRKTEPRQQTKVCAGGAHTARPV